MSRFKIIYDNTAEDEKQFYCEAEDMLDAINQLLAFEKRRVTNIITWIMF